MKEPRIALLLLTLIFLTYAVLQLVRDILFFLSLREPLSPGEGGSVLGLGIGIGIKAIIFATLMIGCLLVLDPRGGQREEEIPPNTPA